MKDVVYKNFKKSSRYYDIIYSSKNYKKEAEYILSFLNNSKKKQILDLGCGTGSHLKYFSKKFNSCTGIDMSKEMLKYAKIKNNFSNIKYLNKDISAYKSKKKFDIIISLFHVVNYLKTKSEINNFFYNSHFNLKEGGYLIFDFWNSNLRNRKIDRKIKYFYDKRNKIKRISVSRFQKHKNLTRVRFTFQEKLTSKYENIFKEDHLMKIYSLNTLKRYALNNKFHYLNSFNWLSKKKLTINSKAGIVIFQK